MALFGKGEKGKAKPGQDPNAGVPVMSQRAHCRVCDDYRSFSKCWRRVNPLTQCTACGAPFEDPGKLYEKFQPACPRCGEFLEQPGFEYGLCDTCGSRYELVSGTKPGLLPNKQQRAEMDKHGKVWRIE